MNLIFYNNKGKIEKVYFMPSISEEMLEHYQSINSALKHKKIEGNIDIDNYYVSNDSVLPKKDYNVEGIPVPSNIIINGEHKFYAQEPPIVFDLPSQGFFKIEVFPEESKFHDRVFIYDNGNFTSKFGGQILQ